LIGVDVVLEEDESRGHDVGKWLRHQRRVRASVMVPCTADAAAVSGEARNVRPPLPCLPSKLRLLVLTAYWPGLSWSPFMAMHIEQPASRHSAPASVNTRSSPSLSAAFLIRCEPGTTRARTPSATLRPLKMLAAARRS